MRLEKPIRFRNKLSQYSILALLGLVAFGVVVLMANPFVGHAPGNSSVPTANASSTPSSSPLVPSAQAAQQQSNGIGISSSSSSSSSEGSQGSLVTSAPPSQPGAGVGLGQPGVHYHHHWDDGNSTVDH